MSKKFILFDFDGVIMDSLAPAFETKKVRCPSATMEDYKRNFEGNVNDALYTGSEHDDKCRHDIDFFTEYIPRAMTQAKAFPGIREVLEKLSNSYTLIIISSTITVPIKDLLNKFNLAEYFTEVMGNDVHTSKVEKIKMVFSKYGTDSKSCVFITDTLGDMREANKMEVGVIGVTWGFHGVDTLKKGNPFKIVNRPEELIDAVQSYFDK